MVTKKAALSFALILMLASLWLTVTIIMSISGMMSGSIAVFGGFYLYNTFYYLAFYVPLYLFFCSVFLLRRNFNKNDIIILIMTLLPFFTAGTALRIFINRGVSPFEQFLLESFGSLSPLLLLLLVVIETILIINTALYLKKSSHSAFPEEESEYYPEGDGDIIPDQDESTDDESDTLKFQNLSLSTVSSLKSGKKRNIDEFSEPGEDLSPDDSPEYEEYAEINNIPDHGTDSVADYDPEQEGVDYSEPAYFRQQRDAQTEDVYQPGIDETSVSAIEEEISEDAEPENIKLEDVEFYNESEPYEADAAHYEQDEIISLTSEQEGILPVSDDYEAGDVVIPPGREHNLPEAEDVEELIIKDEKGEYDPLTQYNDQIEGDAEQVRSGYDSDAIIIDTSDSSYSEKDIQYKSEEDYEDEEENDESESDNMDNTELVRQYFESARFIQPPKKPGAYNIPVEQVLDFYAEEAYDIVDARTREEAEVLKKTLAEFKIEAEVTGIRKGPVITMFEILPAPGVKLSRITNLADNIALRLAASRVRIVAPIPGKHAVGIEVPNRTRAIVSFREIIEVNYNQYNKYSLPVVLGKDITGEEQIVDLTKTPHLLIAGATGSGKSVCVNSLITSILYKRPPRDVKMILIDPKIVELKLYNGIPHLLTPVITDSKKAFQALQYCVFEMERRYTLLDALSCRDIKSFNQKIKSEKIATMPLPYIVVVVDEFADLMATTGKELESTLARLAAMSRAVGIHLVLATQRPSIDVITGLIKANIPSRIAFMVASKTDSRIIIDSMGAEMLLGKGDMLFTSAWNPYPVRIQGAFLSEGEVEKVVEKVKEYGEPEYIDDEIFIDDEDDDYLSFEEEHINDPLMDRALEIVTTAGKASASYLQRRLKIGYNRAARLVEEMERKGIVGPQNGSKPRDLLHIPDKYKE